MVQVSIAVTFIIFLLLFTVVGIYSATRKQNTTTDYLLADRNVNPWLIALSAMATGQSGFLFIGQIGFAYKLGISSLWLTIGWLIGDYLAWYFVFQPLREISEQTACDTVSSFLSQNSKSYNAISKHKQKIIAIISALITIIFLGSYAAAQLIAGSKALNAVFGWDYNLGIIIGAIIVVVYCFSGGIRASIWTDSLQGIIMVVSLLLLLIVAVINCGGIAQTWQSLAAIDPGLISWNSEQQPWGFAPFFSKFHGSYGNWLNGASDYARFNDFRRSRISTTLLILGIITSISSGIDASWTVFLHYINSRFPNTFLFGCSDSRCFSSCCQLLQMGKSRYFNHHSSNFGDRPNSRQ